MNKKLEIGMYIRAEKHGIKKILGIGSCCGMNQYVLDEKGTYTIDNGITKASHNIIDLIEVGDILKVNDFKDVYTIYEVEMFRNPYTNEKYLGVRNDFNRKPKRLNEIPLVNLSIVTKEQFKSLEYEVK